MKTLTLSTTEVNKIRFVHQHICIVMTTFCAFWTDTSYMALHMSDTAPDREERYALNKEIYCSGIKNLPRQAVLPWEVFWLIREILLWGYWFAKCPNWLQAAGDDSHYGKYPVQRAENQRIFSWCRCGLFQREEWKRKLGKGCKRDWFHCTMGNRKIYIQSAYAMPDAEKEESETKPFTLTGDSFPKIVVRKDIGKSWYDETGVLHIGLIEFLLNENVI